MKLLVLQLKRIGDLILTTPALRALREQLPQARITLAVDGACRDLMPGIDSVDEKLVYRRQGPNGALWRKLLFRSYDVCLDFTGNDRSALFTVLSKSPKRVAFDWVHRSRFRALFFNHFVQSSVRENHTVDHYLDMLRALDLRPAEPPPVSLHLPEWTQKKARQLLAEAGVTGPYVIVQPGTARPEKYWLPERWAEVMGWCEHRLRLPCVITGSPDAFEQEHIALVRACIPAAAVHDLSGRSDLLTLGALIAGARLVLSVDSAAMHLGAAFERPQVALFGQTNPFHWRPRHAKARVVVAGDPSPDVVFKPRHRKAPTSEIFAQRVINAITSLLPAVVDVEA